MFKVNRLVLCAVAMASAAALAGCGNGTGATTAAREAPEQRAIVVDSVPAPEEGGLYVAQANGFFRQQGLNVKIVTITGGEAAIPGLQSGKVQLIAGNYVSFILAQMAGHFDGKPASFSIVAAGSQILPGTEALYVLPHSRFKTVAQLAAAHATVGLDTAHNVGQVLLGALLEQSGYKIGSIQQVTPPSGFRGVMTMLRNGTVDAAWLPQPFATMAQQEYGATELADFDQGALQGFPFTGYIGMSGWVRSHPKTVAAFDRALAEGQRLADTDTVALQHAFEQLVGLPAVVAATMPYDTYPLGTSRAELQRVSNAMYEFGLEPGRKAAYPLAGMIDETSATSRT